MTTQDEIIFIHGMGCGGDVWTPLQARVEARGWRCASPTLLEEDRPVAPPGDGLTRNISLADYISDARSHCDAATARTGRKPVVVGHSMGGLIALALASEGACSKAVCITPAPPAGIANRTLWAVVLYANVLLSGKRDRHHKAWRFGVAHVLLNRVPKSRHQDIYNSMRYEPGQAFVDMMRGLLLERTTFGVPLLLISAGRDRIVPPSVVAATAQHYKTALRHYPKNGHWIIDEPDNERMIADIVHWLGMEPELEDQITALSKHENHVGDEK